MSNEAVKLRQAQRADCVNQQMMNETGEAYGRLSSPIIEAKPVLPRGPSIDLQGCCEALRQIALASYDQNSRLLRAVERMSDEFAMSFIQQTFIQTKDSVPFVQQPVSGIVTVPPSVSSGDFVTICSVPVNEGYIGILEKFGVAVFPQTSFADVFWRISINDSAQPKFTSNQFVQNTLSTPLDFKMYIPVSRTLVLSARNASAIAVDVAGVLTGFLRPLR